ncbi:MAG: hypothetical protein AB7F59_12950 [Bdellovibrionales bacterium]
MEKTVRSFICIPMFMALILALGCQRKEEEKTGVSLTLKTSSGMNLLTASANQIQHIVVSVTGAGMPPYIWEWDSHDNSATAPSAITVSVPTGQKLIQVGLYVKNTSGGGSFLYGDQSVMLSGSTAAVAISPTSIAVSNGVQGRISGRYMSSTMYTGSVVGYLVLPNGKPPMPLLREEIFSGWFNFFGINGLKLKYVHEESQAVIFESVEIASASGGSPAEILIDGVSVKDDPQDHTLQVWVPAHYTDNGTGAANMSQLKEAEILLMGYFGPNRGSRMACVLSSTGTYNSTNSLFSGASPASPLTYDFSTYNASKVSKIGSSGGDGAASCIGTVAYEDYLEFIDAKLRTMGGSSSVPIRMVFKNPPANSSVYLLPSGANVAITAYQLPFIWSSSTSGGIDGIDVFGQNSGAALGFDANNSEAGPTCLTTASGAQGFSFQGTITDSDCATNCSKNLTNRNPVYNYHLLFCPYWMKNGQKVYSRSKYRTYASADFTPISFVYTMAAGDAQKVLLPSGNNSMNCRLMHAAPSVAANYDASITLAGNSTGTVADATVHAAADVTCTGGTTTTLNFPAGSVTPQQFRVKAAGTLGQAAWTPAVVATPGSATASMTPTQLELSVGYQIALNGAMVGSCGTPAQVKVKDHYNNVVSNQSTPVSLVYAGANSASVLGNGCNGGLLPMTITNNQTVTGDITSNIATGTATITPSGNGDFVATPINLNW